MKGKFVRFLLLLMFLGTLGVFIYIGIKTLKPFSIGGLLVFLGILLMFGGYVVYYLGGIIVSFCGHKVIGQIISFKHVGGSVEFRGYDSVYVYIDKKGKYKFGTIRTPTEPMKTVLIRYCGPFKWVETGNDISQEEYNDYEWSNIKIKDAEIKAKKFTNNFWIMAISCFIISALMIVIGGIML